MVAEELDGSGSCSGSGENDDAFDWRRDFAEDEWRESAAEARLETAGLGGAGRDEVSESRFDVVQLFSAAAAAALSEIGVSELGGRSGMVIWAVGVLIWKTDPGVGVVGDTADMLTDSGGGGLSVPVGVTAPSLCGILSWSWSVSLGEPLRLLEDDGRDANSCAPRRGGG